MKKSWLIILALTLVTAMFAYEVVAWHEDFEGDVSGWTHYDGNEPPNNWHIYNYGGTQGDVWWMGDPELAQGANIGGYLSHQYLVLDTPARTLTAANATLNFKLRYHVEDLGEHEGYNGWDACNVRISTDGGTTWQVINGTPVYNATSCYSFGHEHGEGPGIPGWGGHILEWTDATFNLSAYVGKSVKIRFAFASDPAYDTTNNRAMFGMMVDDISFGGYTNNGVDDGQMTWQSLVPLGGDLWHLATDPLAPSPTHIMKCQNAQGSYNPNMLNYLVSPPIQLPNSGEIRADFMLQGEFVDNDAFPNVDYFGWEISIDDGESWRYMSNPYDDPNQSNYVYSDAPDVWMSMVDAYSLDGYISDFAGAIVRFRWMFRSDEDQPQGIGIMIDDVKIYNDIFIAAPGELTADVDGSNVTLSWTMDGGGGGGEEGWLHYDGENAGNAIGTGSEADFDVAAKWDAAGDYGINPWVGMNITKIKFFPSELNCEYAIRVWTGGAGTLVYDQAVPNPAIGQWNEITLTTPYTIPAGTSLMAGYRCNTQTGHPAGCDEGPEVNGYGNMMRFQGSWTTLTNLSSALTYNWNIRVYVQDAAGREYEITELPSNSQHSTGTLSVHKDESRRDASSFKVFRNQMQIDEIAGNLRTYTDMNVEGGLHYYYLTAMYGDNESTASNIASAFVMPNMHVELGNDDGSAESGYNVGAARQMAVKMSYDGPVDLRYAKIYVHTANSQGIIIRIFDNDGPDGLPNTQLAQFQYPASSVVEGWNYVQMPDGINIPDGQFYVGIYEAANAPAIGVDTSSNGNSYIRTGSTWDAFTAGELMIRAIVEPAVSSDDPILSPVVLDATNYPNPFNPETTISFSVPTTGHTTVKIYNLKGQVVRSLVNDLRAAGQHVVIWNGKDDSGKEVSSGLYFYRVSNDGKNVTRKMLLSK
ncbi:MAG: T9SS type A sorting domain-containing protein [Candidatus Cloacimonetes bacterium]|nr:T9SS type A sorting domain-containing protein [Candidatus Cloacimonadota bacterium]